MNRLLELLLPDEYVPSVCDIDLESLKSRRREVILIDLDNTLVPWRGYNVPLDVREWLQRARRQGINVCLVSNTRFPERLERLARELDLPFVSGVLKPRRGGFRKGLEALGASRERAVVVGDQVFTDILGGNRLGAYTILVRPLSRTEFIGTKISRVFERLVLCFFDRRGILRRSASESAAGREH